MSTAEQKPTQSIDIDEDEDLQLDMGSWFILTDHEKKGPSLDDIRTSLTVEPISSLSPTFKDFWPFLCDDGDDQMRREAFDCLLIWLRKSSQEDLNNLFDQIYETYLIEEKRNLATQLSLDLIDHISHQDSQLERVRSQQQFLIDFWIPRLLGLLTLEYIKDSLAIITSLIDRFSMPPKYKNIYFVGDYFCTGILLGSGNFASVYLGRHTTTAKVVAIKTMDWDKLTSSKPKAKEQLRREIEIMKHIKHPNLVQLYDVQWLGGFLFLVMEYCSAGTLEEYLAKNSPLSESAIQHIFFGTVSGLKYLNENKIIHRDLKPANILLYTGDDAQIDENGTPHAKIADFTFARLLEPGTLAYTLCGSPMYMAPEIFMNKKYTDKGDLWSLGVVFYQLIVGRSPFEEAQSLFRLMTLQSLPITVPDHIKICSSAKELLHSLLQTDPIKRIEWKELFSHPFVSPPPAPVPILSEVEKLRLEVEKLSQMASGFSAIQTENAQLKEKLRTIEELCADLQGENRQIREKVSSLEKENAKQSNEIKTLNKEKMDLFEAFDSVNAGLEARVQQLQAELLAERQN